MFMTDEYADDGGALLIDKTGNKGIFPPTCQQKHTNRHNFLLVP